MLRELAGIKPEIHSTAFVHERAEVIGKVKLSARVSLWPFSVLRGDVDRIEVGDETNIQDNCVLHTTQGLPTILGRRISVGHSAILHGCQVGDDCLIGMGSILLDGVVVEPESIVAAGALCSPGFRIPKGHLAMGIPAKIVRPLRPEELEHIRQNAREYLEILESHRKTSRVI